MRIILAITMIWISGCLTAALYFQYWPKKVQPSGEAKIEILAITEDGTKIYRLEHKKFIVPLIVAETKTGHITTR